MKRILAVILSILLLVTLVAAPPSLGAAANAAEPYMGTSQDSHGGMHNPDDPSHHSGPSACQIYCAAAFELSSTTHQPLQVRWQRDGYVIGRGIVSQGTAPEVADRPPKQLFV